MMRRGTWLVSCGLGAGLLLAGSSLCRAAESELPCIAPKPVRPVPYAVELTKGGALKVTLNGNSRIITSDFSLMPGWARLEGDASTEFEKVTVTGDSLAAEAKGFSLSRKVTKHDECFEVADTLTNKTADNLPLIVRHQVKMPDSVSFHLSGRKIFLKRAQSADPQNPTTIVLTKDGSLGLLAMDDVFRVHVLSYAVNGFFGIADQDLVVKPNSSITLRFAVFPSAEKGYFDQINAMRRYLNVNFQFDGSIVFCCRREIGEKNYAGIPFHNETTPIQEWHDWFSYKAARYGVAWRETAHGLDALGPDWLQFADVKKHIEWVQFLKKAWPGLKTANYFGADFYVLPDGKTKYAGCEVLNPDGTQANYRDVKYPLWLPVDGNAYAKDLEKTVEFQTQTIPNDGLYWDEFTLGAAEWTYGPPWDGVSADIDPQTHQIARLKTSIVLITQPWREKVARRILGRNQFLITNSGPVTERMATLHFTSFTETGSLTNCTRMHLCTPIALGDHITERSELDCYRWMLQCLSYGCVYYWYHDQVLPITHKTLTTYMYPITPVELGEGYLLGKERIITAKSGLFSFGDSAPVETHFFNAQGVETPKAIPTVMKDGKTYYKVELAEFESCALVRK